MPASRVGSAALCQPPSNPALPMRFGKGAAKTSPSPRHTGEVEGTDSTRAARPSGKVGHKIPSGVVSPAPVPAHRIPPWARRTRPRSRPPRRTSSVLGCTCPNPCTGTRPHHMSFVLAGRNKMTRIWGGEVGLALARHISFSTGLMNTLYWCTWSGADCSTPA